MTRARLLPDTFTLTLFATVALATLLPARGPAATAAEHLTTAAIALLFFLHGARLSREAVLAGLAHWRLHLVVFASTFVLFPLLGLLLRPLLSPLLPPALVTGVLYLCVLPATVQSAIAFTAMARGNVPAALCSASASTLLGVFLTPVLANTLITSSGHADASVDAIGRILLQLAVPFVAGHLLQPRVGGFVGRHAHWLGKVDRSAILLVVYTAFSAAVVQGLWREVPADALTILVMACLALLALVLVTTTLTARSLGFSKADEITIVFCGSKKSLASGVPMAKVLFAAPVLAGVLLPVMLFHQLQLTACAMLARRYGLRAA